MHYNAEQERVINELDKNILLLASAGTGKTGTLAARVAQIIESKRAKAEEILCMTFTNKASREIKEAITRKVGTIGRSVRTGTFHEVCLQILQEEGKGSDRFYMDMIVFDEEECQEILKAMIPSSIENSLLGSLQQCISFVKEYRALYNIYSDSEEEDYHATIMRLCKENLDKMKSFFTVKGTFQYESMIAFGEKGHLLMMDYSRELKENHGVDFTDLITGVYELFRDDVIRHRWRQRFSYICVDEVQDTSTLEYHVMEAMWPGNHVLLCGDFFQTIYEWRGSNPRVVLQAYEEKYSPIKIVFYANYRATKTLFDASLSVLQTMFPNAVASVYTTLPHAATSEMGAPIVIHEASNREEEGAFIFKKIQALGDEAARRCCILVRQNGQAQDLSRYLQEFNERAHETKKRSFFVIDQFKFYRRQEIKDVLAFFKLCLNPFDAQSAKRIITRFVGGIGVARMRRIEEEDCRRVGLRLPDFMDIKLFEEEPYEALLKNLEDGNVVVFDVESTGVDTTTDEIIQIAAIRVNSKGEVLDRFERFIRPSKGVGDSEAVHGFSDAWLADNGEDASLVLDAFRQFSHGTVIVGHNVTYDMSIFSSELGRHDLGSHAVAAVYDTLDIYRRFHPNEIKHTLAYLSQRFGTTHAPSHNAMDDILATVDLLLQAVERDIRPTEDKRKAYIGQYKDAFATIGAQMATLRRKSLTEPPSALLAYVMNTINVIGYYERHNEKGRIENIRELYRIWKEQEEESLVDNKGDLLNRALQRAALTAGEGEQRLERGTKIPIITVHQAKGSEFDYVFLAGMEEGVFPFFLAQRENRVEEEQRLFYVAITRAKKELTISYAIRTNLYRKQRASQFLSYIKKEHFIVE